MKARILAIVYLIATLCGCSTPNPNAGFSDVVSLINSRKDPQPYRLSINDQDPFIDEKISALLNSTLTADKVVQLAYLSNPTLQYQLLNLTIGDAERVQAGRLRNPGISYAKLTPVSEEYDIERQVMFDVIGLLTIPLKISKEKYRFEQTKLQVAIDLLRHANQCRQAYYEAVTFHVNYLYLSEIALLIKLNTELALRMEKAGNWSNLEKTQALIMQNEIQTKIDIAKLELTKSKEKLIRLMGIHACPEDIVLPEHLPPLSEHLITYEDIEHKALECRLDIQAQRAALKETAKSLGLTKATRFISIIDLGYVRNTAQDIPHQSGYNIIFDVPLFDWGDAKVAKSEAIYMQSVWLLREKILKAQSQVREAYNTYQTYYAIAHRRQINILPLEKQLFDEVALRYNGMLVSPFDLLKQKQDQIESMKTYISNLRDFWISEANLQFIMMGADHGV